MTKKLIIGTMLLTGMVLFSTGMVFASEDVKPWESKVAFREDVRENAREMGMEKEDFLHYRTEAREQHREERMLQREERLELAVEKGCITEEEMESRLQQRKGRLAK